jgi:hypothetical protein
MSIDKNPERADWRTTFLSVAVLAAAGAGSLIGANVALAADTKPVVNEQFADLEPAIAEMRSEVGQDRRAIVKANMLLTDTEARDFWPLYDQYRAQRDKVADRKVRLISDYLAKRDGMSQDDASAMMKEFLAIEKKKIALKESHASKMMKKLSARTVARFFQIDQKLDATVDLVLAAKIPLTH